MKRAFVATIWIAALGCNPYGRTVHAPIPRLAADAPRTAPGSDRVDGSGAARRAAWWRTFGDSSLSAAVEAALAGNLQVRAAWARVAQAETLGTQARSALWPQVGAQADVSRRRSILVLPDFTDPEGPETVRALESDTFSLSLPASYEVDVFGRTIAQGRGADADEAAVRDDVDAVAITVAASTVEAYFSAVYQRALRALLGAQLQTSETYLELVELRFREGLGTALDVYNQRAQVDGVRAQLSGSIAQEVVALRQLALLVGRASPDGLVPDDATTLPDVRPLPEPGVHVELLDRRPDLRAARRRVEAADERAAATFADRLPRLVLSGSVGLSSNEIETLFDRFVYTAAGSLQFPVWDGDRRRAVVAQNRALVWERTEQLAQTWLVAIHEVQSALVLEQQQREQLVALRDRVGSTRAALEEARQRYAAGLLPDYLNVLQALNAAQQAEQQVLAGSRQLLSHRTQLFRALGGDLHVPEASPPEE